MKANANCGSTLRQCVRLTWNTELHDLWLHFDFFTKLFKMSSLDIRSAVMRAHGSMHRFRILGSVFGVTPSAL